MARVYANKKPRLISRFLCRLAVLILIKELRQMARRMVEGFLPPDAGVCLLVADHGRSVVHGTVLVGGASAGLDVATIYVRAHAAEALVVRAAHVVHPLLGCTHSPAVARTAEALVVDGPAHGQPVHVVRDVGDGAGEELLLVVHARPCVFAGALQVERRAALARHGIAAHHVHELDPIAVQVRGPGHVFGRGHIRRRRHGEVADRRGGEVGAGHGLVEAVQVAASGQSRAQQVKSSHCQLLGHALPGRICAQYGSTKLPFCQGVGIINLDLRNANKSEIRIQLLSAAPIYPHI